MSSVWVTPGRCSTGGSAPFFAPRAVAPGPFSFFLMVVVLTSTGVSYFTRLCSGGIMAAPRAPPAPPPRAPPRPPAPPPRLVSVNAAFLVPEASRGSHWAGRGGESGLFF